MEDDYSDILGSGVLNVKPQSSLPFGVKAGLWICALVLLYIIGATAWKNFLRWRELSYRLAMRRRHGIPDDDHRPFNVAYAAVQHAREKREALRRSKSRPMSNTAREQSPSSAQDLRQRTGPTRNVEATWVRDRAESFPKGYRHSTNAGPSRHNPANNGQQPVLQNEEKVLYPRATELVTSANHPMAVPVRISKTQSGSRRRNHTYMDIDQGSLRSGDAAPLERAIFKRGSKREYGDAEETEDVLESKRAREKRARKISLEKANLSENMEVDEDEFEDENADGQVSRGKKRDREEAGSTFGGDDEDRSEPEEAEDDTTTRRRTRKRRSVAKRKSDLATITRGKKRDRDIDEETSDEGSDRSYTQTSARKRRTKKEGILDEEDVSMEESPAKGKGRKIGEEWTSNGAHYKIGPNGQRLRQALVKKARQKYHMPQDSQHPDRDANLEVYVETWLSEEEYQDVKTRHLLAWQDTPKASVERDTHEVAQPPPSPVGKSLLWKSTATPPATTPDEGSPTSEFSGSIYPTTKGRISYDPRRQSTAVDVATRVNPFHQYPAQASKRIASGNARVSSAGLVDSTNSSPRTGHRMYSKWEKQDLEANAMMKMREVARKKENEEKERQEKERQEKERAEREKAEKDKAAIPSVPIITVTEPAEDKPAGTGIPSFFAKPAVPPKDAANSPVAIHSPVSLPASAKSGEKTAPTESRASSFPSATPATTPFTFAAPASNPFASVAKPPIDSTKPGEQPKPPLFVPPQPSSVASASNPAPAASTPSFFSFPKLSPVPEPKKSEQNVQASGPPLLSRLGPGAAPAAPLQPPAFSFTKPTEAPKSFFSTPTTTASSLAAQPPASTSTTSTMPNATAGSSALKFDFKVSNKPSTGTAATPASTASDASKPGPGASIFSFKPTVPSAESNAGASGAPQFKFAFSPTAKDVGGTKEINGGQGSKQTLTFGGFGAPSSKSVSSVFSSTGAAGDKTSQPGFGTTGTSSDKSGPSFKFDNTAPSGGANKPTGFSAFGSVQNSSSTSDSSSKPPVFGSFAPASGTAAFGMSGALGGTPSFNASKPADGTNSLFSFGKTSTTPAPTPVPTTLVASTVPNQHSSFALGDTAKAQSPSNAPSFSVNRTPLNKAGASEAAAPAFSAPPNPFQVASSSGGSTTNPTTTGFGVGGSGQPASNSTSSSLFGALGGSGQSGSNTTASSTPFGQNAASTLGVSSSQSIFGSTSNSTSTSTPFAMPLGAQAALSTTNMSQSPFGAPSGQQAPSSVASSVFGGPSVFGNAKPGTPSPFGAFGNTSQSTNNSTPQNSAPVIQFGQTSMGTPNNTGGQN